jgi:SSS family solute:Na+ symporter
MAVIAVMTLPDVGIHNLTELKAALKPDQLVLLRSAESSPKLPWYSILLGYPVIGLWYWCADQTIVQRVLGAKTLKDAQTGPVFAGFIKILPVFIMVIPGILAYALFRDIINVPNDTLPVLITQLLPTGLRGILAAALLAALMSTIAAALNSSATLVSVDIVKRIKPDISDKRMVRIGQWTAGVVMMLAIAWSPLVEKFISIFDAINEILAVLSPPIAVVFLYGVFWKRGTEQAAVTAIITGIVLGLAVFLIDFPVYGDVKIITEIWGIPYMMQCWWLFVIIGIIYIIVSLMTPPPSREQTENYTLKKPLSFLTDGKVTGITDPRILSLILVVIMIGLYIIFK